LIDWEAIWLTLRMALVSTIFLMIFGTPLAWWLAHSSSRFRFLIRSVVTLPLVLPPTVLGFYLLIGMGPKGPIGAFTDVIGIGNLAFTFPGLVIGSIIYSLPFVVNPIQNSFELIGKRPLEAAGTLGASPIDRFFTVAIPLARPGVITGAILGFAHTLGEFGVVMMIGGNIPGKTRVLSVAIYDHVDTLQYDQAHILSAGMLIVSFVLLLLVYRSKSAMGMRI